MSVIARDISWYDEPGFQQLQDSFGKMSFENIPNWECPLLWRQPKSLSGSYTVLVETQLNDFYASLFYTPVIFSEKRHSLLGSRHQGGIEW